MKVYYNYHYTDFASNHSFKLPGTYLDTDAKSTPINSKNTYNHMNHEKLANAL